ncbi:MAG: PepSY-like domain-containing protein [Bacteroidota bacterium]
MKKIFLMLLTGSLYLTSCNKNESISPDNQSVVVSDAVASTLRLAYPNATNITYSEVSPTAFEAEFNVKQDELIVGISKDAKLLFQAASIEEAALPAIALDYLTTTYPGYTLIRAGEKKDKAGVITGYVVDLKYNELTYHIHFDATGKFLTSVERKGKHNGIGVKVAQADLPATIKTYLDTTYPNYTFDDAISFSVNGVVKGYGVRITTADNLEIGLMFDGAGVFLRSREGDLGHHSGMGPGHGKGGGVGKSNGPGRGKDGTTVVKIEKTAVPAAAITYLDSNYAGYAFIYAKSFAKDGVINAFEVEFTLSSKTYEVYFDAAGVFVKEKIKK